PQPSALPDASVSASVDCSPECLLQSGQAAVLGLLFSDPQSEMLADPGPLYSDFSPDLSSDQLSELPVLLSFDQPPESPVLLSSDQPSKSPVLLDSDLPSVPPEFLCSSPLSEPPDILGSERSSQLPVQPGLLGLDQPLESSVLQPAPPGFQRLGRPPESSAPPGFQRLG
ncbi:hypothetical protein LDENG_00284680, partial [Lucifuga dentata]